MMDFFGHYGGFLLWKVDFWCFIFFYIAPL